VKKCGSGFTLIEVLVVLVCLGLGTSILAGSLFKGTTRKADQQAYKSLLIMASKRSLNEASHYGVHYDSITGVIGLFEDLGSDGSFNGLDTLKSQYRLHSGTKISILDSDSLSAVDICFRKNGATSEEVSYAINMIRIEGDTATLQVIAASGITQGGL
jgi:prepilin-type N-terminal cleavage/methylation domain-containing protein